MAPNPVAGVHVKRAHLDTGRAPRDDGGRDRSNVSAGQGTPRIVNWQLEMGLEQSLPQNP